MNNYLVYMTNGNEYKIKSTEFAVNNKSAYAFYNGVSLVAMLPIDKVEAIIVCIEGYWFSDHARKNGDS